MRLMLTTNETHRRVVLGSAGALAGQAALLGLMLPYRDHLSIATPPLVFVVPVVLGVVVGGVVPGVAASVAGFLFFDIFFLPPYGTLAVRRAENWIPLL